jgi:hypothetical protein
MDRNTMIIRLDEATRKKIHESPLSTQPSHDNPLLDWSTRLFRAGGVQYILVCNTATFYATIFYGRGITNCNAFLKSAINSIRDTMVYEGYGREYDEHLAPATGRICFAKSLNRKVTASINELIIGAEGALEGRDISPFDAGLELHGYLLGALGTKPWHYGFVREAFGSLVQSLTAPPTNGRRD